MDSDKNITININSGTIVKAILLILLFFSIYVFKDLVLVVLTAVVIASAIEPAVRWFKRYNVPRLPAVVWSIFYCHYLLLACFMLLYRHCLENFLVLSPTCRNL